MVGAWSGYFVYALAMAATPNVSDQPNQWLAVENQINQAHGYDPNYCPPAARDRTKAIRAYEKALMAEADYSQRLHVLFRLAQLHGTCYSAAKGEKPDFEQAIRFSKLIVEKYPPSEPLAIKAMNSIGSYYLALNRPEAALQWFRKALEFDVEKLEASLAKPASGRPRTDEQPRSELYPEADWAKLPPEMAIRRVESIKFYQGVAVKMAGATAWRIDHSLFAPEMNRIAQQYPNRGIARLSQERLKKAQALNDRAWQLPSGMDEPQTQVVSSQPATRSERLVSAGGEIATAPAKARAPSRQTWVYLGIAGIVGLTACTILFLRKRRKER